MDTKKPTQKGSSRSGSAVNNRGDKGVYRTLSETKKPTVLTSDATSDVKGLKNVKGLKDPVVLLMIDETSGTPTQITICRPIGVTKLEGDDWVMMQSASIPSFLANSTNPYEARASGVYKNKLEALHVTKGFLKRADDGTLMTKSGSDLHRAWREAAKAREAEMKHEKIEFYLKEERSGRFLVGSDGNPGKGTKAKTAHKFVSKLGAPYNYLSKAVQGDVDEMRADEKSDPSVQVLKFEREIMLNQYETRGGPDGTAEQRRIAWLRGVPPAKVKSLVIKFIYDPDSAMADARMFAGMPPDPIDLPTEDEED